MSQQQRLRYRLIDFIANRQRLSAFDITEESLKRYYKTLSEFKPKYLYGYVSMIEAFAIYLNEHQLKLPSSVLSIITTSEVLTDDSRVTIESATGLRVFNEYGCGEVGSIAHECERGSMHIMSDNLIVEVDGGKETG